MKIITPYLSKLFKNNGVARGWLYIINCFAAVITADLVLLASLLAQDPHFLDNTPLIVCLVFILKTLFQSILLTSNTMRAYIDQHLSRKPDQPEPPKSEQSNVS